MIRAQQAPTVQSPSEALQPAMTAFASIVLAALPGLGAKSGADGSVTADGKGAGGAFEALMAALTVGAAVEPEGQAPAAATVSPAAGLGADLRVMTGGLAAPAAPGLLVVDVEVAPPRAPDDEATRGADAADALAAAATVMVAPTPTASPKVATPDSRPQAAPAAVAASPRLVAQTAEQAFAEPVVASDAGTSQRPAVGQQVEPTPVADVPPAAVRAQPVAAGLVVASAQAQVVSAQAPEVTVPVAAPSPLPSAPEAAAAAATFAPTPPPTAAATSRPATDVVTSLVGRLLDGARKPEADATTSRAIAEAASPPEAQPEATIDTPVELAVDTALSPDAPVPVEAAVVETPVAPAPAPGRRAARPDAARADVAALAVDPAAPDVKMAARSEARAVVDAAPASSARPEAQPAPAPLAEPGVEPEPATLDTTSAAPTPQAVAELPPEAAPARGSPETVARLAADIARKLDGQTTRFDVQLDPLGLGKVDISIEINADGRLSASLSFDSAQTAADLRSRAGELRQALENAGFDLADGGLSFDMNNPGGSGGREARETLAAWSGRAFETARSSLEQAEAAAVRSPWSRTPSGGVDIRI